MYHNDQKPSMDSCVENSGASRSAVCKLRHTAMLCLLLMLALPGAKAAAGNNAAKDAIVKIYTVISQPDYFRPWNTYTKQSSGTGCVIAGNRILTNAHVVADHTFIEVRRHGRSERQRAEVLWVSHDVDLALLTVPDRAFFEGIRPLPFGDLPQMQEQVTVYGFPMGGDTMSITTGVVSRIEHQSYTHSSKSFLAVQIDAAINPGNSGGPVLAGGSIAGVVMQGYRSAENIGYMVPVPIIAHFLRDIEDGTLDGFPALGIVVQKLESSAMKKKYNMAADQTGVFVNHIFDASPAAGLLRPGDIILSVDGHPIADDGTVEFRLNERTSFRYFLDDHQLGEKLALAVLRDGSVWNLTITLSKAKGDFQLVPGEQYDRLPRYVIFGGIVFSPLTKNLMKAWGREWEKKAPQRLLALLEEWPSAERREVVVALQVLAADVNKGYHHVTSFVVDELNGRRFADFNEFYGLLTAAATPFITFRDAEKYELVVDRQQAIESHAQILTTYRIDADRSADLKSKPPKGTPHPEETNAEIKPK